VARSILSTTLFDLLVSVRAKIIMETNSGHSRNFN
jgi:hypothetical protein